MDDIGSLLNSLSPEDMENLKKTAQSLLSGSDSNPFAALGSGEASKGGVPDLASLFSQKTGEGASPNDLLSGLGGIMPLLSRLNVKDKRCDLLYALKPLISEERRHKVDEAATILKMTQFLPMLNLK